MSHVGTIGTIILGPGGLWGAIASRLTSQKHSVLRMEYGAGYLEYSSLVPGKKSHPCMIEVAWNNHT
jgi:hypothetical protein